MTGSQGIDTINVDFDRETGATLNGWPAVAQNIQEGLLTDFGKRIMREYYGSIVPRLLGQPLNQQTVLSAMSSVAAFLSVFEPRFEVSKMDPSGFGRDGVLKLKITGIYKPRALLGDETSSGFRELTVAVQS